VFQLAADLPPRERLAAVLWNLDDFKASQARDEQEGDWRLPPAPKASTRSADEARRELAAALESGDDERADRAAVGAWEHLDHGSTFEILTSHAVRDFSNLGHKPIFVGHADRVLRRIDERHGLPVIRALVHGLLDAPEALEEHDVSARAAHDLRDDWKTGRRLPEESLELAHALRGADPGDARAAVVEAVESGLHPDSAWDGIRLAAAELFARRPSLLPVHPTTVSSALRFVYDSSRDDSTRRIALLQAAAWIPLFREALAPRVGFSVDDPGLDELVQPSEGQAVEVRELFEEPTRERTRAFLRDPGALAPFEDALRRHVFRGGREHHVPKYAAVLIEDVRTADPRWRGALFAAALEYLPSTRTPTTEIYERALS